MGWGWHVEDVEFVEAAIELCDGRPSDVEREGLTARLSRTGRHAASRLEKQPSLYLVWCNQSGSANA